MTTTTLTTYYCQFCDTVANFFKNRAAAYRHKQTVNKGVAQLRAMSDIELKDIGLCRGDIHYIANKHYDDIIERMNGKKVPLYDKMPEGILDI